MEKIEIPNRRVPSMSVVQSFNAALSQLYNARLPISKSKITHIVEISMSPLGLHMYKHLVQSVERFIHKCRPEYKLPGLYVIDAIIRKSRFQFRKEKDVYSPRFGQNIVTTFKTLLFTCRADDKSKIVRVLNLWQKNHIYPPEIIQPLLDLASAGSQLLKAEAVKHKSIAQPIESDDSDSYDNYRLMLEQSPDEINQNMTRSSLDRKLSESRPEFDQHDLQKQAINRFLDDGNRSCTPTEAEPPYHSMPNVQIPGITDEAGIAKIGLSNLHRSSSNTLSKTSIDMITTSKHEHQSKSSKSIMTQETNLDPSLKISPVYFNNQSNIVRMEPLKSPNYSTPPTKHAIQATLEATRPIFQTQSPLSPKYQKTNPDFETSPNFYSSETSPNQPRYENGFLLVTSRNAKLEASQREIEEKMKKEKEEARVNMERKERGLPAIRAGRACLCTKTIWIRNLLKYTTESDIREAIQDLATIVFVKMVTFNCSAYIGFNTRIDASRIYHKIFNSNNFLGVKAMVEWAPGPAIRESWCREFWEADQGCSYIPFEMIRAIDLDLLEDGCVIDMETLPAYLHETLKEKRIRRGVDPLTAAPKQPIRIPLINYGDDQNLSEMAALCEHIFPPTIGQTPQPLQFMTDQSKFDHDNYRRSSLSSGLINVKIDRQQTFQTGYTSCEGNNLTKPLLSTPTGFPPRTESMFLTGRGSLKEESRKQEGIDPYSISRSGRELQRTEFEFYNIIEATQSHTGAENFLGRKQGFEDYLFGSLMQPGLLPAPPLPGPFDNPFAPSLYELKTIKSPPFKEEFSSSYNEGGNRNPLSSSRHAEHHRSYRGDYREQRRDGSTSRIEAHSRHSRSRSNSSWRDQASNDDRREHRASRWSSDDRDSKHSRYVKRSKPDTDSDDSDKYRKKSHDRSHSNQKRSGHKDCEVSSTTNNDEQSSNS